MTDQQLSPKDSLDHAWRYFALHAAQRMSMFNYFLLLFGVVSAGLAGCLRTDGVLRLIGALLGASLSAVAFTFWKLDQRSAFLVKHAEFSLCQLEQSYLVESARLFQAEPSHTEEVRAMSSTPARLWTYGSSFRLVFGLAGVVGVLGSLLAISLYFQWCK